MGLQTEHFSFFPDETNIGDCQTIEKVHQNNNHQEDESDEQDRTDDIVGERNVGEFQFSDKHRRSLQKSCANFVEERIFRILLTTFMIGVEHDVETDCEGDYEEDVPKEKLEKGNKYCVEHG